MQKLYIHQAISISTQGFWEGFDLPELREDLEEFKAVDPDYKTVIPVMSLRRMSKITKMALMCSLTISKNTELVWDGIIVGTGLGNLADTEKFLTLISATDAGLNSPTAFTQSSHNTLSGQIALQLKNHGYNMTHVQRGFSFENALQDAILQANCGMKNILLGSADEHIPLLDTLGREMKYEERAIVQFGEGASFFQLSADVPSGIFVQDALVKMKSENQLQEIDSFVTKNKVDKKCCLLITTPDMIVDCGMDRKSLGDLVGNYMTNSGIAIHLGCAYLQREEYNHVLILNANSEAGMGLTLFGHE
ncbi:beta-ketoacyl synthase chain length factor [Algoriphagus aquimarinus]|uniref:Beta-ketoacyl synthase, N-terminal domain n=1 Tax=Algoriphagus aquimarinus TaxID=237018 RepID=A0A1I0XZB2_9BACT|nr:beta-ketoacyl synthase chain length factor [Algoriphagus aquimarinus]SFB06355.1 Beta-ketoacyl synthase, N-terminal domain [Algoriphagus aquimarinus]